MKNLAKLIAIALVLVAVGCQEEEPKLDALLIPTNLEVNTNISQDGSGLVEFRASAENALTYKFSFEDGSSAIAPDGVYTKRFTRTGLNTYMVVVTAYGTGGISNSKSLMVEVQSDFQDAEAVELLSGGSSKTWYLAASEPAHLGVGPASEGIDGEYWIPKWYAAAPFEKCGDPSSDCLCDDELTFRVDAEGQLYYELDNKGQTYFNVAHRDVVGGSEGIDFCYDFDTSGEQVVALSPSEQNLPEDQTRGTAMTFTNGGFMGYYVGSNTYEILSISENSLYVRTVDALNPVLAWYHKFTTTPPGSEGGEASNTLESIYTTQVWADEFDGSGAPDASKWTYDLGTGSNGWGNNEAQSYTSDAANVRVENGVLKITAIAENGGYTSARIKTQDLYEFTYGRVDVSAKLPQGGGTWPAIWTLGANFDQVGWPECGEMDIMEHVGNDVGRVTAALHYPGFFAGNAVVGETQVEGATADFHTYTMEWTPDVVMFAVDGTVYHTFDNDGTTPFNSDMFMILNVAMGGTLGGDIDPAFDTATMEVDYVRVFQ